MERQLPNDHSIFAVDKVRGMAIGPNMSLMDWRPYQHLHSYQCTDNDIYKNNKFLQYHLHKHIRKL